MRGVALKWFESYLRDRKQFAMVNGKISEFFKTINISVLQGSILGPFVDTNKRTKGLFFNFIE